jgi:hypothetical protein
MRWMERFRMAMLILFRRKMESERSQVGVECTTRPDGCPTFAEAYVGRKRRAKPTIASL